jgi:hypothetical protein
MSNEEIKKPLIIMLPFDRVIEECGADIPIS